MSKKKHIDHGGPAFVVDSPVLIDGETYDGHNGMSLRDWFAGHALAGLLANPKVILETKGDYIDHAFQHADLMLAARKGK